MKKKKFTQSMRNKYHSKSGAFTIIELLIVIAIISIFALAITVAINPGHQFATARDATRESHLSTLNNALLSYKVKHGGDWADIVLPSEFTEICNTNLESPNCSDNNLIDLSELTYDYINHIPVDPEGGDHDNGTGYFIRESSVALVAVNYETRFVGIGITESDYLEIE